MDILVVSQFFPPEMGAPAGRFYDFAQKWVALGHRVTVVTGFPNFPAGRIHEGYEGRWYQRETLDGIDVRRCLIVTSQRHGIGRALGYASFLVSATLCVLFARLRYDVVVATSPPPSIGVPGLLAALRKRVPLIFDIRDIWPEAIVQSGRLTNPLVIRLFEGIARFLYRRSTRISVVTEGWKARLAEIGVAPEKVEVLPNGVDVAAFDAQAESELPGDFAALDPEARWFTYAGIYNRPQGLEVIFEAAEILRQRAPALYARSQFVLVGEGPIRAELEALREAKKLDRLYLLPRQPRAAIFSLLRRSFAVLVTLRPRKDTSTVPSKIYESLASGRPVLFSAAGEGAETIRRAQGGRVCTPGDPESLADAMQRYLEDPAQADRDGAAGRAFVLEHYDRGAIAAEFARLLEAASA